MNSRQEWRTGGKICGGLIHVNMGVDLHQDVLRFIRDWICAGDWHQLTNNNVILCVVCVFLLSFE